MKIIVAQFWTDNIAYSKFTRAINEKYCQEKGYGFFAETDGVKIREKLKHRAFTWYKPFLLLDVLEQQNPDYVLFLDADAIIVNNSYSIEDFIKEGKDIVVTEDYGPSAMNAGVILLKNTEWVKWFLQRWYNVCDELEGGNPPQTGYYENALWHDQTCFSYLLTNDESCKEKIEVIDNKVLNGRFFNDVVNKNFIFHAFSYGQLLNRTIDTAYYTIFNIPLPKGEQLLDIVSHYNTDKHYTHGYFELVYNELFRPIRESCKIFMEVGIYDCESIKLWRDYFVNAEIIGVEYNLPYSLQVLGDTSRERMIFEEGDQSKVEDLERIAQKYTECDVILDDGSHVMRDQQITLAKLFRSLKPGGIYVLEDLHTSIEIKKPECWMNWGDKTKTLTLDMLRTYIETGKIHSDYMTQEEMDYLNNNIETVEIYNSAPEWSYTSVIKKKDNK